MRVPYPDLSFRSEVMGIQVKYEKSGFQLSVAKFLAAFGQPKLSGTQTFKFLSKLGSFFRKLPDVEIPKVYA
jgi:hypothetical protein